MELGTHKEAQSYLYEKLRSLSPSGADGFEGAMASVLSEITGQRFEVSKSGHQDGSDARNDPANLFRLAMEAKRYKESTGLGRDELQQKITDASRLSTPPDLWILAVTKPIDATLREALYEHGASLGMGIAIIDSPENPDSLGDLAVLCALGSEVFAHHIGGETDVQSVLAQIQGHPHFDDKRQQLIQRLTHGDIGYDSAKRASRSWLMEAQRSRPNALSRLGGHLDIGASKTLVKRTSVQEAIATWQAGSANTAVLLGDEGVGKTWAALDWVNDQLFALDTAPLILFVKASNIRPRDARETLAEALYRQTEVQSQEFWRKRLRLWEKAGSTGVRIAIVLDGLNENFQFKDWASWLQPLFEDTCAPMYHVLLTCWPNWWREALVNLASLEPAPLEIPVEPFNDSELDAFLEKNDLTRASVARPVLDLMRVPRLSILVIKHREALRNCGDVTAERVIYEDWKDRLTYRGPKAGLTDDEMRAFVSELGRRLSNDISQDVTRRDVIEALSKDSGKTGIELMPAVSELTSGAWLIPCDKANTFKVSKAKIPFALGAALVDTVHGLTDKSALEAKLGEFLDPLKANSLGTAILRAAATILLIEEPETIACDAVLDAWIGEQNFQSVDFEAYWRLAGLAPERFIGLAEKHWLAQRGTRVVDEVLIKSLSSASQFETFQVVLKTTLLRWLGTIWPDPKEGQFLGKLDRKADDSIARAEATHTALMTWWNSSSSKDWTEITIKDVRNLSWLSVRAIAVLSYMDRSPYSDVYAAWALGRSIMGSPRQFDEIAWVLRANSEDQDTTRGTLLEVIAKLGAAKNDIATRAADYLAEALSGIDRGPPVPSVETKTAAARRSGTVKGEAPHAVLRALLERPHFGRLSAESLQATISSFTAQMSPDSPDDALLLLDHARELALLLLPADRAKARHVLDETELNSDANDQERLFARLVFALIDAPAEDQCHLMLTAPPGEWAQGWGSLFKPVPVDTCRHADTSSASSAQLASWLLYLRSHIEHAEESSPKFLRSFIGQNFDEAVRHHALELASDLSDKATLDAFASSGDSAPSTLDSKQDRVGEFRRSRALLVLHDYDPPAHVLKALNPEAQALILKKRPDDLDALQSFETYLRGELERAEAATTWTFPQYWFSHLGEVERLYDHNPGRFLSWFEPFLEKASRSFAHGLRDDFPHLDVLKMLIPREPHLAERVFDKITDEGHVRFASRGGMNAYLFDLARETARTNRLDRILSEAKNDAELLSIANWAHGRSCLDWLFDKIEELEQGAHPADLALAYTLLGYCDVSSRAEDLWTAFHERPPSAKWLAQVFEHSVRSYQENANCRANVSDFWSVDEPVQAYALLAQITYSADSRLSNWFRSIMPKLSETNRQRWLLWDLNKDSLELQIKRSMDRQKKEFFHTRQGFSMMAPWI